jgi:hypothetical protein
MEIDDVAVAANVDPRPQRYPSSTLDGRGAHLAESRRASERSRQRRVVAVARAQPLDKTLAGAKTNVGKQSAHRADVDPLLGFAAAKEDADDGTRPMDDFSRRRPMPGGFPRRRGATPRRPTTRAST